jgi:SAM-dependent methyltransferase
MSEWWEEMFEAAGWQQVQLGWDSAEDADDQVDRIVRALKLEPGMRVLDVPCGTGRIASRLAERGYEAVGVDITDRFLEVARARDDGVRYDKTDMRELSFEAEFDAALCFWGSFGYFDDDGNLAQATAAARALRPGGRYLIDVPALESILAHFRHRNWFEVEGTVVLQETAFAIATGRIETTWTFLRDGQRAEHRSSMHLYSVKDLTDLLVEAGFTSFETLDDELEPFELDSHRLWLVATR